MSKVLQEIREYKFEDGTHLYMEIDYKNNKFGFVQHRIEVVDGGFTKQEFVFIERGVEYANGWLNILSAMQYAIRDARDRMMKYRKEEKDRKEQLITQLMIAAGEQQELKESKGKKK